MTAADFDLDAALPAGDSYPPRCGGSRLRGLARSAALSALAARQKFRPKPPASRTQILLLHHVLPQEITPFRKPLAALAETRDFISYSEAVRRIQTGDHGDRPGLAFSFDDGRISCRVAAGILEEHSATGMFFICPPIIGETNDHIRERFCRHQLLVDPVDFLSWNDIAAMKSAGHEFGAHTLTHPDCGTLSPAELEREIVGSRDLLADRLGSAGHFAWPLGRWRNWSDEAHRIARAAGFVSVASGERGMHIGHGLGPELPLRRESVLASWPISHIRYFLSAAPQVSGDAAASVSPLVRKAA